MEQTTLNAYVRNELKKGASRRLRKAGKIPAVVYGHAGTSTVSVDEHEFHHKFRRVSENTIISLKTEEKSYDVLVKQFQEDLLTGKVLHIDFYEIEQGVALRTNVPVHLHGTAPGVREGGIMEQLLHEIEVECLPKDIPQEINVDISSLVAGSSVHVFDIPSMEGVRFLSTPDSVIVIITHLKEEAVAAETEEAEGEEAAEEEKEAEEDEE